MLIRNSKREYGVIAKFFHWVIALIIFTLFGVGLYMADLPVTPAKFELYGLHKSFGILVLSLVVLRFLWKMGNSTPELPKHMSMIEALGAKGAHLVLYLLMFGMPLSGWLMSSAAGFPVSVFGLFTLPDLIAANKEYLEYLEYFHEYAAYFLMAVVFVHMAGALYHHFYYKDTILKRMLPW